VSPPVSGKHRRPRAPRSGAPTRTSPNLHPPPPPAAHLPELVRAAGRWRAALFGPFGLEPDTDAYRLVNDAGDGLPGLSVDAYAGHLVVQVARPEALALLPGLEEALQEQLRPHSMVRKLRYTRDGRGHLDEAPVAGAAPPELLQVREHGLRFEVALLDGLHTGLFTDMRDERARLRTLARDRRVLNTFAYTGSFSVAAAAGGAAQVTSVDLVPGALERAQRNFAANGFDPSAHRLARMEVLEYLRMAHRRGWRFDMIVLDPPTFASFDSGRWSAKREYPELLSLALRVLDPGGLLWVAVNTEGIPAAQMERNIAGAAEAEGRAARMLALGGLPPDYPTPVGRPDLRYLKVWVIQL